MLLAIWSQPVCENRASRKPFAAKTKEFCLFWPFQVSVFPPAAALQSCTIIYSKTSCLLSAPCSAVYYQGLSACSVGRQPLFNSAVTSHEDTLESISAAGLIVGGVGGGLLLDGVGTLPVHTNTPAPARRHRSQGVPMGRTSALYQLPHSPLSQIMLCHDVRFPFYVNTFLSAKYVSA